MRLDAMYLRYLTNHILMLLVGKIVTFKLNTRQILVVFVNYYKTIVEAKHLANTKL